MFPASVLVISILKRLRLSQLFSFSAMVSLSVRQSHIKNCILTQKQPTLPVNRQRGTILIIEVERRTRWLSNAQQDELVCVSTSVDNLGEDDRHWCRLACIGDRESGHQEVTSRIDQATSSSGS